MIKKYQNIYKFSEILDHKFLHLIALATCHFCLADSVYFCIYCWVRIILWRDNVVCKCFKIIYLILEKSVLSGLLQYIVIHFFSLKKFKAISKRNLSIVSFYCSRFKDSSYSINISRGFLQGKHAINLPAF